MAPGILIIFRNTIPRVLARPASLSGSRESYSAALHDRVFRGAIHEINFFAPFGKTVQSQADFAILFSL
jgi:hypothetical protein